MNIALILSGGTGTRVGSEIPKQYIEVGGKPVISYCFETICRHQDIDAIQIVADIVWQPGIREWITDSGCVDKFRGFSLPGGNRQLSIYNGLKDIMTYVSENDCVMIHDAARPLLSHQMITSGIEALAGHDGVLPVIPMKDTVYMSEDGKSVSSLLDRSKIFAGQAPEFFKIGRYFEANQRLIGDIIEESSIMKINGSTEPAIMTGMDVVMIPGDENNYKITTKADLDRFKDYIEQS